MKTMLYVILFGLLPAFNYLFTLRAEAHGTDHRVIRDAGAVTVECIYSDNEPMSYAKVMLYGPSDTEVEFQNGRTDRKGRFAFFPDREGTWRIEVGDGMGHLIKTGIEISSSENAEAPTDKSAESSMLLKAALGLSLIANIALISYFGKRKMRVE